MFDKLLRLLSSKSTKNNTELIKLEFDGIPDEFNPIKEQVLKYILNNSTISTNKTIKILHRPWVAELNWGLILYEGVSEKWLEEFLKRTNRNIPDFYKRFLLKFNGCFIYGLSFYGLTPSIYKDAILNRETLQCLDLTSANDDWINDYEVDNSYFYFGGRFYSDTENLGYFVNHEDQIISILKNGKMISKWDDFSDFLNDEILIAEKMMIEDVPVNIELKINKN